MVSGDGFRRRPIVAADFRLRQPTWGPSEGFWTCRWMVSGDGFRCRPIVAADFRLGQPALGLKQRLLEQ
jgi:hypothetical protein